MKTPVEWE